MADEKEKIEDVVEETDDKDVDDQKKEPEDNSSGGKESGKEAKTFSQEQVNKMMAKEKGQGRNAALKELGIDPKDSKTIAMVKAMIESQKSDEQKQAESDKENQDKVSEAERRAVVAEAKAEAMTLGVKPQFVDDVVTLALAKMTKDSDLKTIIGEFKTKYPVWFGTDDSEDKQDDKKFKTGQKGTGSSVKSKEEKKGTEKNGMGQRLAAKRKANAGKSSYWGKK